MDPLATVQQHLVGLYGGNTAATVYKRLIEIIQKYIPDYSEASGRRGGLTERDSILITYGDQVHEPGKLPLHTLAEFSQQHLRGVVSGIHILPFFPYSSDDGFSVIDYKTVDPALGTWEDIADIGRGFRLMFDAVINHISSESSWFQAFLRGDPGYQDYFIAVPADANLSMVVRPRALPLLTEFDTRAGKKAVWTTFSSDQIDLNYHHPGLLLEILDVLLFYAVKGAEFIRLDAIAYLWKEVGTPCIHLANTHRVVQLMRALLDATFPNVLLITETNVPHVDNISYFGDGSNEAQLVYNFALPPLVLHTLRTGNASALARWAASLSLPSKETTFFNFLASHDGIGINPARGLLTDAEIEALVSGCIAHGGLVSYKFNPDGSQSPYELNISYFDALSEPLAAEGLRTQIDRFAAAHAIMLSLAGVPGIYFHSLFGSRSWPDGVKQTGRNRTINRQKLNRAGLDSDLENPRSRRSQVFADLATMLRARASSPAFHPAGDQQVLPGSASVFGLLRTAPDGSEQVACLVNVTGQPQTVDPALFGFSTAQVVNLLNGEEFSVGPEEPITLPSYDVKWLQQR